MLGLALFARTSSRALEAITHLAGRHRGPSPRANHQNERMAFQLSTAIVTDARPQSAIEASLRFATIRSFDACAHTPIRAPDENGSGASGAHLSAVRDDFA
jgi:hypothetical protein